MKEGIVGMQDDADERPWRLFVAGDGDRKSFNLKGRTTMKTSMLAAAIAACALSAPVMSAQEPAAPAKPAMGMDMDKQMSQMQENMKTMQQQMEKLRTTTDPQERQKLMQEHMQAMQKNMAAMRGMGGPTMGMMGGKGGPMMNMDPKQREDFMLRRMDMMQMMMEQMMQHEKMKMPMPAK